MSNHAAYILGSYLVAAVILGGLASSLALTLIVLPAIYYISESRRERAEANA